MKLNFWCNGFAWALAWSCLTIELASPIQLLEAADRSDGGTEYDFELSKGLLLFGNHRYVEAESHLQQAYNAKPGDPTAGYYHGLTLLRLQRYVAAEDRFRDVLRRHPENARARMGLGMALYHREQYADALTALTAAEQSLKSDPLLFYYAGLAASALQAYDQAADKFLQAGKLDAEFAGDPHYQQAVALHSQGRWQEATTEFKAAIDKDSVESGTPALTASPVASQKRWSLNFAVGMQYDSNVVLLPGGTSPPGGSTGISHKDDFVALFMGSGEYRLIQTETWTVGAGYGFFQNVHARLSDFNVQDHTPTVYVQRRVGAAQVRLQYLLDYVTVGGDAYLLSNAIQPSVTFPETEQTFTQAFVRYQYKDFKTFRDDLLGVPVNQTRDGVNWMFGAMQFYRFSNDRWVGSCRVHVRYRPHRRTGFAAGDTRSSD
jgi:Tfp pilus assembly protein PilF